MNKLVSLVLLFAFSANVALADCNFKTDITLLSDGGYRYSKECHIHVGELVQDNSIKDKQIGDLNKAITLKDLAIGKETQRADLWMKTSLDLQDRMVKIDDLKSKNEWLYFGLGVITTVGAGYMASRLIQR